jgi:hypothetical protein
MEPLVLAVRLLMYLRVKRFWLINSGLADLLLSCVDFVSFGRWQRRVPDTPSGSAPAQYVEPRTRSRHRVTNMTGKLRYEIQRKPA